MKSIAIICECNPFHRGHEYLIRTAKARAEADVALAIMSGLFVQRGEPATLPPHRRAEILLHGGADLVLELPFPFCASGADFFAGAGVSIAARLGVQELWFGSECGDLQRLQAYADATQTAEFSQAYTAQLRSPVGTARAFAESLACLDEDKHTLLLPNDLLGIAYLAAIGKQQARIRPMTLRREGAGYAEAEIQSDFPSATALRRLWRASGIASLLPHLPSAGRDRYRADDVPADWHCAESLILGHFRLASAEQLQRIAELGGGLGLHMQKAANDARDLDEFLSLAATKKYTNARILRGILFALTQVCTDDLRRAPAYTRLLAANATGCRFLAARRKLATVPIVTKHTDLPNTPEAAYQAALESRAHALYSLCLPAGIAPVRPWQDAPVILPDRIHK